MSLCWSSLAPIVSVSLCCGCGSSFLHVCGGFFCFCVGGSLGLSGRVYIDGSALVAFVFFFFVGACRRPCE